MRQGVLTGIVVVALMPALAGAAQADTRNRWLDVGGYRQRLRGRQLAIYRARTGGRRVSEHRWRGVFRITVRVFRRGRQIDRCHLRTRWRVRRLPG